MKEKFARWGILFRQYLKRDWKKTMIWVLGITLFSAGFIPAFEEIAKGDGAIGLFETMQNPAMTAMVGPTPIDSALDYTLGAMYAHEMLLFCGLFAMIVSILHVVGHTRKEEELGLTELVRSFQIGRQANSLAVLIQTVMINLLIAFLIGIIMISYGTESITVQGSFLFGASVGMAGVLGAVIALFMAQIMPTSSGATGASLGIIGLLYIVRAGTDSSNVNLSKLNPMGWHYLTYPYTENNWVYLIFSLGLCLLMVIIAFMLEGARDMGSGYLPVREGRASTKKSLLSVPGLFIRLNRGTIMSWLVGFSVIGLAYGSIYGDMQTFLSSNELVERMFLHAGVSIEESFTGTIMMVMTSLVIILPIAIVNKLYVEETRSHINQLLATKITRRELYWTSIWIAIFSGLVGILLSTLSLGGSAIVAMGESASIDIATFLTAGFNHLPSMLFFIGLAAFTLGWIPRAGKIIYVYLCYSFMLNYFAGILDLPNWFLKTAIQSWIPMIPMEDFDIAIFITLTVLGIVMMMIGFIGYKRRDMLEGA